MMFNASDQISASAIQIYISETGTCTDAVASCSSAEATYISRIDTCSGAGHISPDAEASCCAALSSCSSAEATCSRRIDACSGAGHISPDAVSSCCSYSIVSFFDMRNHTNVAAYPKTVNL